MSNTLGKPEMLAESGVTWRQLDYWTRTGYLHTISQRAPGSGYLRIWPATEAEVARTMARLTAAGINLKGAERVARGESLAQGIHVLVEAETP